MTPISGATSAVEPSHQQGFPVGLRHRFIQHSMGLFQRLIEANALMFLNAYRSSTPATDKNQL
jgi:hypothetical protein